MTADLNYSSRTQKTNIEEFQSKKTLVQPGDNPLAANNPGQATDLPPFNVLIKWLSYYHTQTGSWPDPEEQGGFVARASEPQIGSHKPSLKILPIKIKTSGAATSNSKTEIASTNYDFRHSIYYQAAQELIENHVSADQPLNETSIQVLASFLAWCHHPAFQSELAEGGGGDLGMYLSLEQWSKGLKIRKGTLGCCLKELEALNLIKICLPLSQGKRVKTVKRYYSLTVMLQKQLPVFNPTESGITSTEQHKVVGLQQTGLIQVSPEPLDKRPEPGFNSSPYMNHDINNYKNIKLTNNHEHDDTSTVTGTVEEKLEFLSQKACFPGYTSPDGLTALDNREALKFASNPNLDLFSLREIYQQVLTAWAAGKCSKNPIGFFHYALTRRLNQKLSRPQTQAANPKGFNSGAERSTGTTEKIGSRFRPDANFAQRVNRSSAYHDADAFGTNEPYGVMYMQKDKDVVLEPLSNQAEEKPQLDIINLDSTLKAQVVDALQDRFRQPDLAEKLLNLGWIISLTGEKLLLQLQNPGSSFPLGTSLSQSEQSLIKIAVSQLLKRLQFNILEIEIILT